ncbi:hypothetical protein RAD15_04500 [Bradyrhizobium sp. 14AA]
MEQRESPSEGPSGAASQLPPWIRRTTPYAPDRRARMLEHMARARSLPRATATPQPPLASGWNILGDAYGYTILFGIIALLFRSPVPLYLGAFLFLTDGERLESALRAIGIRFDPDTIGPDIIKGSVSWFGWFALLASMRGSVPAWLAPWLPPADSWSFIAGIALALAVVEAFAALTIRRAGPWFGWAINPDSLIWTTIKLVIAVAALALLVLLGAV